MSFNHEYDSAIAYNYDILFRKFEIDVSRLDQEIIFESSLDVLEEDLFNESNTLSIDIVGSDSKNKKQKSAFKENMAKLGEKISKFISDVIQMVSDMFSKSSHLDIETYLDSSQGSIEMEYDLERVHEQVKDELRKGRKLIKAISSGTRISEDTINKYVDRATEGISKYPGTVMTTASTYKKYQKATGRLREMEDELKGALSDCKDASGFFEREDAVMKVYKSMQKWTTEGTRVYTMFSKDIYKEAMKQKEKEEKEEKKKKKGGQ